MDHDVDLRVLEDRIDAYGPGAGVLFESFIINLLQLEASKEGRRLDTGGARARLRWDAFAPDGLGSIQGPIGIEIVRMVSPRWLENFVRHREASSDEVTLLIISLRQVGASTKYFQDLVGLPDRRIILWGRSEVLALMKRHQAEAKKTLDRLFSLRLKTAISHGEDDWIAARSENVQTVREQFRTGRFSLLLGAGVSSSAGLPDWDTLLNSLFVSMLSKKSGGADLELTHTSSIVRRLRQVDGPSALVLARYIRKGIAAGSGPEHSDFIRVVTEQLYALRNKAKAASSSLIKEVASLCMPIRTGAKVRSVVTYNFDDLVENELVVRGVAHRSIFEEFDLPGTEELPIYHVHGFLPQKRGEFPNIDKATLVFSEEGYHQIYRDAYHWSNLIQLGCLKDTSCLMIGLSLTDPNLRRLLEIAAKSSEKPRHFAFLRRLSYESFSKEEGKSVVNAPAGAIRDFLDSHHRLNEEVLRELGVTVIWYEEYADIPNILKEIRA